MSTKTTISNLALDHIGEKNIASIDDNNKRAEKCKLHYPLALNSLLEEHRWGFAEKRVTLALVSGVSPEDSTGYEFAYAYPSDCLVALEIYNSASTKAEDSISFILQSNTAMTATYILTNQEDACLVYTGSTNSFTQMKSALFQKALSHMLASGIAMPLTHDPTIRDAQINLAFGIGGQAKVKDANEQDTDNENFNDYVDDML